MAGRLATPPGFTPKPLRGLWTREARLYLLQSLAGQPNPDQDRAERLLHRNLALRCEREARNWQGRPMGPFLIDLAAKLRAGIAK